MPFYHITKDLFLFLSMVYNILHVLGEQKTKPTQSSVRELRGLGLSPDVVVSKILKNLPA